MKTQRLFLVLALGMIAAVSARACPACNIYNYLAESVVGSSNIVVGKVEARLDNSRVKVEVRRVLQGSYQAGQVVEMKAWTKPEDVGKVYIFSDPWDEPSFRVLELPFEEEVRFLLRLAEVETRGHKSAPNVGRLPGMGNHLSPETLVKYRVKDVDEAIILVQGWSNESKAVGMDYLHRCKPFPSQKLIRAIESIRRTLASGKEVFSAQNRLGNLVEALMLAPDSAARAFVLEQVEASLKSKSKLLNWMEFPAKVTEEGEWLAELLGLAGNKWTHRRFDGENPHRRAQPALVEKERQVMLKALPKLTGLRLSETVYALYETGTSSTQDILALLNSSQSKDEFALGVYWSARRKVGPWSPEEADKALAALQLIDSLVTQPVLKKQIVEDLKYGRKWRPEAQAR